MRQTIGFILFWISIGMLLMLLISHRFIGIIMIALLMIAGYNLYHCGKSC